MVAKGRRSLPLKSQRCDGEIERMTNSIAIVGDVEKDTRPGSSTKGRLVEKMGEPYLAFGAGTEQSFL